MSTDDQPMTSDVIESLRALAVEFGLDATGGRWRRTSSRMCLGVEHGDYNGTDLFGVGTDRFLWVAYKANTLGRFRLASANCPEDGLVDFRLGEVPAAATVANSWARFPLGVNATLAKNGYQLTTGMDAVLFGNIPGGGMSRSASLSLNLIETILEVNDCPIPDGMEVVRLAQAVENDYIGSPCGNLDQIMIYFAKADMGTYYRPAQKTIEHIPLGEAAEPFSLVSLDTGTDRPGLEKSTYKVRREECERLVELASTVMDIQHLADVKTNQQYEAVITAFQSTHPYLCKRLKYLFEAQQRFRQMLDAWKTGDVPRVGWLFRQDGFGLRDDYEISGPELESMCDIAREVEGVYGERMLGGGDKGASGAIVAADAVDALQDHVASCYPQRHPDFADRFAVHACKTVDGIISGRWSDVDA